MKAFDNTQQFGKDWKKLQDSQILTKDLMLSFRDASKILQDGGQLPEEYLDHPLKGNLMDYRDFHLMGDVVVIYKTSETKVTFVRIGSHSELFS